MRSVILISTNDKEVECLFLQWKDKATNIYVDGEKLSMLIAGERIYIDYWKESRKFISYDFSESKELTI